MRYVFLALSAVVVAAIASSAQPKSTDIRHVCDVVAAADARVVTIRGTAQRNRDGLVIGDYTCPLARNGKEVLPFSILVAVSSFRSAEERDLYRENAPSPPPATKFPLFQVVVRGTLRCKEGFKFTSNEQGEFIGGTGYGSLGLIKCRMDTAEVLQLYPID